MTALAVAMGIAIVALVLWDVAGTVLHPTQRGPLCQAVNRGSWVTADGGPRERARWRPDVGRSWV